MNLFKKHYEISMNIWKLALFKYSVNCFQCFFLWKDLFYTCRVTNKYICVVCYIFRMRIVFPVVSLCYVIYFTCIFFFCVGVCRERSRLIICSVNHDQLKLRPYFLPWVSKNRRYRILKGIDWLCHFSYIIEFRSLKFGRRI